MGRRGIVILSLIVWSCGGDAMPTTPDLDAASDFALADVDGAAHSLNGYRGRVVVLNFFATWCGPCQDEMPKLQVNIWQSFRDRGVVVLGVDLQEDLGTVKLFGVNNGLTFPLAIDATGEVFRNYAGGDKVANVPFNVIIDKNGNIRYSQTGYSEGQMIQLIESLL